MLLRLLARHHHRVPPTSRALLAHPRYLSTESPWNKYKAQLAQTSQSLVERTKTIVEKAFAKDETSWTDALRKVVGLKPLAPKEAVWYDAVDEKTGKRYQYNDAGEVKWAAAEPAAQQPKAAPKPEATPPSSSEPQPPAGPSVYELQIKELGTKISALETEREAAQNNSDMATYKALNKQIRDIRREIESLTAKANSTSVVIKEERKGAWEQFSETLKDTPLLKDIFGLGDSAASKKLKDAAEDAREAWETSQHPLVYRAHSAWSAVFAETEMGEAIREVRKVDPDFTMEDFLIQMEEDIIPKVLSAFLRGDVKALKPWLGEAAMGAVTASVDERKRAGRVMDKNILAIQHVTVFKAKVVEKMGPIIVVQFMAQQIDCLYDAKTGAVAEGDDNRVAAVFYAFAMTRDRDPDTGQTLPWNIKEFAIVGSLPWT